jgi:uncharacterized protein (TIGR00269 family)
MLEPFEHVAVGVSGGKDSLTLLTILARLEQRFPNAKLTAVTIDEGIAGYREEALGIARRQCERLGIGQVTVSFRELFGTTTDELAGSRRELTPCSYCGVFRRKALNRAASMIGATKIATAHNLDDEAQTVLLNLLHGDVTRLIRNSPVMRDPRGKFITRIKPLALVPEKEIVLYAYARGFEFQSTPCPHGLEALRSDIRVALNRLEEKHPGMKYAAYRTAEKLKDIAGKAMPYSELNACERCGDPTPQPICEGCKLLEVLVPVAQLT